MNAPELYARLGDLLETASFLTAAIEELIDDLAPEISSGPE